jgi:hypothetical protein
MRQDTWCNGINRVSVIKGNIHVPNTIQTRCLNSMEICCLKSSCYMYFLKKWPYSACELYRPSNRRLSAKLVPTFADRGCRVVSATDPHGRILDFLDRSRYYFCQVAPQLYSRGWVDPVPNPLLLRKSGSAGKRTWDLWICRQELWPLDHRGGPLLYVHKM